ncbi:MAG: hypothetical protein K9J17_13810 [Flavobacteriales bacterium]|nr:hypothetical protein [Flavobacteriales bacterium]
MDTFSITSERRNLLLFAFGYSIVNTIFIALEFLYIKTGKPDDVQWSFITIGSILCTVYIYKFFIDYFAYNRLDKLVLVTKLNLFVEIIYQLLGIGSRFSDFLPQVGSTAVEILSAFLGIAMVVLILRAKSDDLNSRFIRMKQWAKGSIAAFVLMFVYSAVLMFAAPYWYGELSTTMYGFLIIPDIIAVLLVLEVGDGKEITIANNR